MNDCTTCRHYRHLTWLDEHMCKYPGMGGSISPEDVHKEGCPGWEPREAVA